MIKFVDGRWCFRASCPPRRTITLTSRSLRPNSGQAAQSGAHHKVSAVSVFQCRLGMLLLLLFAFRFSLFAFRPRRLRGTLYQVRRSACTHTRTSYSGVACTRQSQGGRTRSCYEAPTTTILQTAGCRIVGTVPFRNFVTFHCSPA